MHLLITRPEPDASELKARLESLGIAATVAPLLSVETLALAGRAFASACGIIATSRNALRAIEKSEGFEAALSLPLFAVGPGTATAARAMGFMAIITGPEAGRELAALIKERAPAGQLLHVAGEVLAYDLAADLAAAGLDVETVTAYRTAATKTLPPDVAAGLENGAFDGVILMSPKTADVWCQLNAKSHSETAARRLVHLCLSERVAQKLAPLSPPRIAVSPRPNAEEMLALAGRLAAQSASSVGPPGTSRRVT